MMNRALAGLLALALVVAAVGCGKPKLTQAEARPLADQEFKKYVQDSGLDPELFGEPKVEEESTGRWVFVYQNKESKFPIYLCRVFVYPDRHVLHDARIDQGEPKPLDNPPSSVPRPAS